MNKQITEEDREEVDKLCVLSDRGRGRPKKWTDKVIKDFADGLVKYSELKTSITLHPYAAQHRYSHKILPKLASISVYFREALRTAKVNIGNRREQGSIVRKFDAKTVSSYARMYDPDYNEYRMNELQEEELIKAQAKIKALEDVLESKNKGAIKEYLDAQKIIKEIE